MEMKRNLNENSTRSTAGCLPVPLFNQKKRTRQPLTSNPLKNDPGISTASDSCDFPLLPTDWTWEMMTPELPPLTKVMNTGTSLFSSQIPHSVSPSLRSQDSMSEIIQINTERNKSSWNYGEGNKNTSLKTWDRNDFRPLCKQTNLIGDDGISSSVSLGAPSQKQLRVSEPPNLSHQSETEVFRQTHSSKIPASSVRGLDKKSASQPVKANFQQNQLQKKRSDTNPKENTLKETSTYQLKFKEKENSLRIICAVIESMRYWCEHAKNTVLLFEILAVLDSAVTSGPYYSKTFLMRDGKNSLPCVFYEIDRELPRLIRGRVHRCVGSYDQKKNIFKCVSVRPASVSEQKSFQALVKISDTEMKCYTNVLNEI